MQIEDKIKEEVVRHIKSLCPGIEVIAFGSRVSGKAKKYSDFDLCLKKTEGPIPFQKMEALDARFAESNIPFKVDLVDYHLVDEEFQKIIDTTGKKLDT